MHLKIVLNQSRVSQIQQLEEELVEFAQLLEIMLIGKWDAYVHGFECDDSSSPLKSSTRISLRLLLIF